jgi:hypothetical protein
VTGDDGHCPDNFRRFRRDFASKQLLELPILPIFACWQTGMSAPPIERLAGRQRYKEQQLMWSLFAVADDGSCRCGRYFDFAFFAVFAAIT